MEDLYNLVQTLTGSERRYFTVNANKESKYYQLYVVLKDLKAYDHNKIPEQLLTQKDHLYEAILRVMRNFRHHHSNLGLIKRKLLDATFLYEKNLIEQSKEQLQEAKDLAEQYGDLGALLEINKTEPFRAWQSSKRKEILDLKLYIDENKRLLELLEEEVLYQNIYLRLLQLSREVDGREKAEEEFSATDFDLSKKLKSANAGRRFYLSRAFYHHLIKDLAGVHESYKLVIEWWQSHKHFIQEESFNYFSDLKNYFNTCISLQKYAEAEQMLNQLDQLQSGYDQSFKSLLNLKLLDIRLNFYINTYQFDKGIMLVPEVEQILKVQNDLHVPLLYNVIIITFLKEEYALCREWCAKNKSKYREDIQKAIRLLNVVSAFELEQSSDEAVFDATKRSASRYYKKNFNFDKDSFEFNFIDALNKLNRAYPHEEKALLLELQQFLSKISTEICLCQEELMIWLSAKLKK